MDLTAIDPSQVIGLLMIAAAVGGFAGQVATGVVTAIRVRSVVSAQVQPLKLAVEFHEGRIREHEGRINHLERRASGSSNGNGSYHEPSTDPDERG